MPTYYINEAVMVLPARGFVDRTLHRFESPLAGDDPQSLEIRRLPMEAGKSLRQLVEADIAATKAKVNGFTLVEDTEVTFARHGAPAILLSARFRARDTVFCQRQAHFAFAETWISFVVAGPTSQRAACDATFDRILQSLEWRTD